MHRKVMYNLANMLIDIHRKIMYIIITARDKRCDGQAGDEPDIPSKFSNPTKPRRVCFVKAGDVPESTKPAASTLTTEYRHRYNEKAR